MTVVVPIEVPQVGDDRRKNWAKVVDGVDDRKSSGWAFSGDFVAVGGIQDVPAGAVLMVYGERGSAANPTIEARIYTVNADGTLSHEQTAHGRAWARTLRDRVAALLESGADPRRGFEHLPDEILVAELTARGYRVTRE